MPPPCSQVTDWWLSACRGSTRSAARSPSPHCRLHPGPKSQGTPWSPAPASAWECPAVELITRWQLTPCSLASSRLSLTFLGRPVGCLRRGEPNPLWASAANAPGGMLNSLSESRCQILWSAVGSDTSVSPIRISPGQNTPPLWPWPLGTVDFISINAQAGTLPQLQWTELIP